MQETIKRKLTAILSADVAGYSRLMDDDEVSTVRTLQAYQKIISDLTVQHNGRVVDSPGDNVMAAFESVVDAVQCAVEIQQNLRIKNDELPKNRRMEFRIGINLGDVIEEGDRIYGDGVNIAARVESFADAGGICISGKAYDQVWNKLDLGYEDLGEKTAKNIRRPIRVYKIPVEFESEEKDEESILDSIIDLSVPTDKPSIAVLPFVNMSGDPEQEYFSDGMTEEIITALSKVPDILVIASTSMFTYKGKSVAVQQVGKELGVKYILEGSVRKADNRIRLTAQLIDAATGNHLWADRYDRELKDIFELQDELTGRILSELDIKLYHGIRARLKIKGTDNLEAYLKWWQGIGYMNHFNKNDNAIALQLFEEVIKLDPNWGIGYAFLGMVNYHRFLNNWGNEPKQCYQKAKKCSTKAISLDSSIPESYFILSSLYNFERRYDESISEAEKAIEVQPNFFLGHSALGTALVLSGMAKEAQEPLKRAIRLSPNFSLLKYNLGFALLTLGRYRESIAAFKTALQQVPNYLRTHVYLTCSYILAGMKNEARKQSDEILRIDPKFSADDFVGSIPYKNQSDTDRILNALRKAGLK